MRGELLWTADCGARSPLMGCADEQPSPLPFVKAAGLQNFIAKLAREKALLNICLGGPDDC